MKHKHTVIIFLIYSTYLSQISTYLSPCVQLLKKIRISLHFIEPKPMFHKLIASNLLRIYLATIMIYQTSYFTSKLK